AKDLGTGKEQSIRITASSGLSEDEVNKMTQDAESHAADDKTRKELAMVRNEADTLAYSVEKSLTEYGDKLTEEEKSDIEAALEAVKRVKESSNDASEIKEAVTKLTNASHKIAEHVYKAAQEQQAADAAPGQGTDKPSGDGGEGQAEEEVVEAEFEDVDKKDE
ncbi:MAG: Hsp70 family protein, partial [Thermodesulfovibrionales bacterium]|nr:Hsp70 family protein [Thermodesulfovibrionales bacterium]